MLRRLLIVLLASAGLAAATWGWLGRGAPAAHPARAAAELPAPIPLPTLLAAHRRGLYPFAHIGPNKWWSPPTRSLLTRPLR